MNTYRLSITRPSCNSIGSVRTSTGLSVKSKLDVRTYQTGITVSDAQMEQLNIVPAEFHGEWYSTIKPHPPTMTVIKLFLPGF
jgi:hypothetical protein